MSLSSSPPTPTPLPSELATRATELYLAGDLSGVRSVAGAGGGGAAERNSAYLYEHGRLLIELGAVPSEAEAHGATITEQDARDVRGFALKAAALTWQGQPAIAIPIALSGLGGESALFSRRCTPTLGARLCGFAALGLMAWKRGERGLSIAADDVDVIRAYAYALCNRSAPMTRRCQLSAAGDRAAPDVYADSFRVGGLVSGAG